MQTRFKYGVFSCRLGDPHPKFSDKCEKKTKWRIVFKSPPRHPCDIYTSGNVMEFTYQGSYGTDEEELAAATA